MEKLLLPWHPTVPAWAQRKALPVCAAQVFREMEDHVLVGAVFTPKHSPFCPLGHDILNNNS